MLDEGLRECDNSASVGINYKEVRDLALLYMEEIGKLGHQHRVCRPLLPGCEDRDEVSVAQLLDLLDHQLHQVDSPVLINLLLSHVLRVHIDEPVGVEVIHRGVCSGTPPR